MIAPRDVELTPKIIGDVITKHAGLLTNYKRNEDMYMSNHEILRSKAKESYKPDNRLVINYAKYIVDTFGGYQLGVPVKVIHPDDVVQQFIDHFRKLNDAEDSEYEVAKLVDIFGHAYIYLYHNEDSEIRMTYNSPMNMVIVHDDTIAENPLFAVRYEKVDSGTTVGEVITATSVICFEGSTSQGIRFTDEYAHYFQYLPVIEIIENDERQGIFDPVITLINALNKAVSEKANDVDYFADAYLKVVGVELQDDVVKTIRDSRLINLYGDSQQLDVGFLEKPNADTTQENLITLLRETIFDIAMVANLSDEAFGNSSGVALAYKLQPMSNLAKIKDRKLQSAFNRMYRAIFSAPMIDVPEDAYLDIEYKFTRNVPRNMKEEAEVAKLLEGQVSQMTKLSTLSIVDNPQDEMDKMESEIERSNGFAQRVAKTERMTDGDLFVDNQ